MNTTKMQYKVFGEGNPLVLVPGGLTGWVSWEPFIPHFSKSFRVILVQLLNVEYGIENKLLPDSYSVRMESSALAESLKQAGLSEPADFIGWSYGAHNLLDYALNNPDKIRTMTLIEPPALWLLKAHNRISAETNKTMELFSHFHGTITEEQLEQFMAAVGFVKPGTSVKDSPKWNEWKKYKQSIANSEAVLLHKDDISRLYKFTRPVLLVKGTGSAVFLHEIIDALGEDLANSRIAEFPEGHAPHIVSTDRFLETVEEFWKNER